MHYVVGNTLSPKSRHNIGNGPINFKLGNQRQLRKLWKYIELQGIIYGNKIFGRR